MIEDRRKLMFAKYHREWLQERPLMSDTAIYHIDHEYQTTDTGGRGCNIPRRLRNCNKGDSAIDHRNLRRKSMPLYGEVAEEAAENKG